MSEKVRLWRVSGYVYGLCVVAVAAMVSWATFSGIPTKLDALLACLVLTMICAVSYRFPALVFGRGTALMVDVAYLAALILLGPFLAVIVASPSFFYRDKLRAGFVASYHALALLLAGCVFSLFSEPLLLSGSFDSGFVYGAILACLVFYSLEIAATVTLLRLKYGDSPFRTLREIYLPLLPADLAVIVATLGVSFSLSVYGPAAPLALFSGTAASFGLVYFAQERRKELRAIKAENEELKEKHDRLEGELLSSNLELANRFVESLGRKDGYTARHAAASAVYAADVARELALESTTTEKLRVAALLQDVGLISVPEEVLLTPPEKLNSVGRMYLEEHAAHGERIVSAAPGYEEASKWVRWHHERVDGTGYPDKLRGEWIPLEAKILAAASTYAALILDGPGSAGLSAQEARRKLVGEIGEALDGGVVRALLRALDTEDERYATAADDRFSRTSAVAAPGEVRGGAESRLAADDTNQG